MINPFYQPLIQHLETAAAPLKSQLRLAPPIIQALDLPDFKKHQVSVYLLRLDQIHPHVSGNKWYKLKYNLVQAVLNGASTLITFGGAWSNHLHAFSCMGRMLGMRTVAVLRGNEWQSQTNPMIEDLKAWGTEIHCISRQEYQCRNDSSYQQQWQHKYPGSYVIPEGGDNFWGVLGVSSLFSDLQQADQAVVRQMHSVAVACGTGNTLVGVRLALSAKQKVIGISALKGEWYSDMIAQRMAAFWPLSLTNWQVFTQYHGGGFGKLSTGIKSYMQEFESASGVLLDPVYTAKLAYGIKQKINEGYFPPGHRLLLIHTGGLQGRRSLSKNT